MKTLKLPTKHTLRLLRKVLASAIAGAIFFNAAAPAYAQQFTPNMVQQDATRVDIAGQALARHHAQALNYSAVRRANQIRFELLGGEEFINQFFGRAPEPQPEITLTPAEEQQWMREQLAELQSLGRELLSLALKNPGKLDHFITELTPLLLVAEVEGQKVYTPQQQEQLRTFYRAVLEDAKSSPQHASNAIDGLALISNAYEDASLIRQRMDSKLQDNAGLLEISAGVSALLNMGQHTILGSFLHAATKRENHQGMMDFDILDPSLYVRLFATMRGQYFGKVSQHGQYGEDYPQPHLNIWSDIAQILAQEGSPASLNLLRQYGVEKCRVFIADGKYKLLCTGIKPFLAGALLSGKSGADKYNPAERVQRAGTTYLSRDGRSHVVSPAVAREILEASRAYAKNLKDYAAQSGLSPAALLALELINDGMGDINGPAERHLDEALLAKYKDEIKPAMMGKFAIVDVARFFQKQNRREITDVALVAGGIGNIVISVWCFWALGKGALSLGTQAYRVRQVAKAGSSAQKMALLRGHLPTLQKARKTAARLQNVRNTIAASAARVTDTARAVTEAQRSLYTSAQVPGAILKNAAQHGVPLTGFNGGLGAVVIAIAAAPTVENVRNVYLGATVTAKTLPITINGNLPAGTRSIHLVKDGDNASYLLKYRNKKNQLRTFTDFKLELPANAIPALARRAQAAGLAEPMVFKYRPAQPGFKEFWGELMHGRFYGDALKNYAQKLLTSKARQFVDNSIILDGVKADNLILKTPLNSPWRNSFLEIRGHNSALRTTGEGPISFPKLGLPKDQLGNLLLATSGRGGPKLALTITNSRKKINALFLTSAISLSAASTGLVGPLEKVYPDSNPLMISLVLPYATSLIAPMIAPMVKRFGATKILLTSTLMAVGSLAIPAFSGFHGFGAISEYSPKKPNPWPLFATAGIVGLSAALTRSSLNPLYKAYDNGGNILKSMAFKNISSFALILPPAVAGGFELLRQKPLYYTDANGNTILKPNGDPAQKRYVDFSVSYPVLLAASAVAAYQIKRANFPAVGKVKDFYFSGSKGRGIARSFAGYGREALSSTGILFTRATGEVVAASALTAGVESALQYTFLTSMLNYHFRKSVTGEREALEPFVPVLAAAAVGGPSFLVRFKSKHLLRALGGDNPLGYRKMFLFSLGATTAGAALMADKDNFARFAVGGALVTAGTANLTNSLLKIGGFNLKKAYQGVKTTEQIGQMVTAFDSSYPAIYIGMALVPLAFQHNAKKRADELAKQGVGSMDITLAKAGEFEGSMWVPLSALGLSLGLGLKATGRLGLGNSLSTGLGALLPAYKMGATHITPSLSAQPLTPVFNLRPAPRAFINQEEPPKDFLAE